MKFFVVLPLIFSMAACSVIGREAGYPGGNLGYVADRHTIFAQGPVQRVDRYLLSLALLSPLIAETADTSTEARISAERIAQMSGRLARLKTAAEVCKRTAKSETTLDNLVCETEIFKVDPVTGLADVRTAFNFETQSHEVARSLFEATKTALDNLNIRTRARNLAGLSPTELFRNILRARFLIPVAQRYFATYRDVTIVLASSVVQSCNGVAACKVGNNDAEVQKAYAELLNRVRTGDDDIAEQERPIAALFSASEDYIDAGHFWTFNEVHASALIAHIDKACVRLLKLQEVDEIPGSAPINCTSGGDSPASKLLAAYKN